MPVRRLPNKVPLLKKPPSWTSKVPGDLLMGKVKVVSRIGLNKINCLQVKVPEHNFFEFTQVFYKSWKLHWTLDPESKCRLGDVILIRRSKDGEQFSSTVQYKLDRVVFQHGNVIDPITKRLNYQDGVYEDEVIFRKQIVEAINEPLAEDSLTHEKKRALIKKNIEERRMKKPNNSVTHDVSED